MITRYQPFIRADTVFLKLRSCRSGQLTKVGRGLGELPRGPQLVLSEDGRITSYKRLQNKTICPTQGCTTHHTSSRYFSAWLG